MEESLLRVLSAVDPTPAQWEEEGIEVKDLYMNYVQVLAWLVGAANTTGIIGRGGGKSNGIGSARVHRNVQVMPMSTGVALGSTYIQLLDRTLPALFEGMARLGYERDKDYWVRRFPDPKLNLRMPQNVPLTPEHSVFIRKDNTVTPMRLVSQDRPGTSNGLSIDWLYNDESKFLNKPKLDEEVRPANRGNNDRFGHLAEHHGEVFTTDMPTNKEGRWLFEAEDECNKPHNQEAIRLILAIQLELYRERKRLATHGASKARLARMASYERQLNELRKGLTHFIEASSFVNVHVLGLDYFRKLRRTLPDALWQSSILNVRRPAVMNGFYADLDPDKHYYDAVDYGYVDSVDYGTRKFDDCRKDADIDYTQPLTLSGDYGSTYNCLHVAQRQSRFAAKNGTGKECVRHLNSFGLPSPYKIQDVVGKFCDYYKYSLSKDVVYVYDQTAVAKDGKSTLTYADEVMRVLKERGWKVKKVYIGEVPSHQRRFLAWGLALREGDDRYAIQRFNRENMRGTVQAMLDAQTKEGRNGFEKDKADEKNEEIDQSTTTHRTDAADIAFYYLTVTKPGLAGMLPAIT
jgi:hypothetical protein